MYVGKNNATLKFKFSGTAFAVYAYKGAEYGGFDVYIDGKKVETVTLSGINAGSERMFISKELADGKHTVEIVCNNGPANIDNIALWK